VPANPRVSVVNLGCRVNRVESDRIAADLARAGLALAPEDEADLIIINTCAVTGEAEAKTRKAVRRALGRDRTPFVLVTGCAVNLHGDSLRAISDRVIAEPEKSRVALAALAALGQAPAASPAHGPGLKELLGRSRLGVKVQDGCNHRCSYCIVWKARGPERSVAPVDVIAEVAAAADAGVAEVVLTGVNLGAYRGRDDEGGAWDLARLIDALIERTRIAQIRISSIEPMNVDDSLVACLARSRDRVAPFLHLPVQSGATSVLRRMRRPYTAGDLESLAERLRGGLPGIALSADVIAGFPGETDDEFEQTLALCRRIGFSRMHVFRYSERPGTPAAERDDQVPPPVRAERASHLRELAADLALADARSRIGTSERAVIESGREGTLGSFHRVRIEGDEPLAPGALVNVAIMGIDGDGTLIGMTSRA